VTGDDLADTAVVAVVSFAVGWLVGLYTRFESMK
jgi:hypothetical protein